MSMVNKLRFSPTKHGAAASSRRRHLQSSSAAPVSQWPPPELELGAPPVYRSAPSQAPKGNGRANDSLAGVKKVLMVMLALGAASVFAGQGTFASFSAETSNNGSSISSGTLTLSNTVNSGAACITTNSATANNLNPACGAAIAVTNVAPGVYGGSAQITLQNTGSIDASKLYLYASSTNSTLTTALVSSGTVNTTTLAFSALEGNISVGDNITVSNDTHSQTFVATAAASGGATSITVTGVPANYSYPIGSTVTDTSSNASTGPTLTVGLTSGAAVTQLALSSVPGNVAIGESIVVTSGAHTQTFVTSLATPGNSTSGTLLHVTSQTANFSYPIGSTLADTSSAGLNANIDCYDAKTLVGGTTGSTFGTNLNFNPIWGNPLCGSLLVYIQELSTVNPSSALSTGSPITSLPVTALGSAVALNDPIVVTSGAHTQTFNASAGAAIGATAIPITSATPNFAYPTTSQVLDPNSGNYCWVGRPSVSATGACDAPISVNLSSALSTGGSITSLPVTALNGDVVNGDTISVSSGTHTQTFTASGSTYVGATSIPVSATPTPNFAYPTTSVVTDVTANNTLADMNADTTHTISNFDTSHGIGGKVDLVPVTANNTTTASTVELGHSDSRTFEVGVYFPAPTGTNQNQLQGLASTFGITWHMDQ